MKGLTKRQREILDYIHHFIEKHHFSPSYREIQRSFKLKSLSSVHKHLESLQKKGHLTKSDTARSLAPTVPATALPIVGHYSLENGIELSPHTTATYDVPPALFGPNRYILIASGTLLRAHAILEGDLLLVEARTTPLPGETALCANELTSSPSTPTLAILLTLLRPF